MTCCLYLGPATATRTTVSCPQLDGRPQRQETEYECLHPDRRRHGRRGSRPGRCLPQWDGPWRLPHQEIEAATLALCARCLLRDLPDEGRR